MNYSLADIGLTEASLTGTDVVVDIETMFDAMPTPSELLLHVSADGNLANICPTKRGILRINKIDSTVASILFTNRVDGKLYTASFIKNPLTFSGWVNLMSHAEEDFDDLELENKVANIISAIGDISLVDHYGGTIVDILNKYTRQVLVDSSTTPNKIVLSNYYGDIANISYDTPIVVQVNNNSVDWTEGVDPAPVIEFNKDIYVDGVFDHTQTVTYPLKMIDMNGSWNSYRDIAAGDMTKNVFYNLVKRTIEITPGIPEPCFVVIAQSTESEISSLNNRVTTLEDYFSTTIAENDTFVITNINSTEAIISNITSNNIVTQNLEVTNNLIIGSPNPLEIPNGMIIQGTTNATALIIGNSLNLETASVTLKQNPGGADLINKSYVDSKAAATITEIMNKFAVGTSAPPATGTPGTFYFQLKS